MDRGLWVPAAGLLTLLCCTLGLVQGEKVLVMPVDGSHWLSMKLLVKELSRRGHEMVVLVPETSLVIQGSDTFRTEVFQVPHKKVELLAVIDRLKDDGFSRRPQLTDIFTSVKQMVNATYIQVKACESLLYNQPLMERLRGEGFQLMLTDPFLPCGSILAKTFSMLNKHM
ncbi:UDP-glucuronosyltransferase 1-2-like [Osmerus eperlanus]|uniref:UDP-glucuronosyltransferase 1-2-like n=1 Tax=Osmerus eperlanus TaxID=29151 RepID=UPI002E0F31F1